MATGEPQFSGATGIVTGRTLWAKGADVASAGTLTLGTDGNRFDVTGTTTINYITTTGWTAGSVVILRFTGILTFTHNAGTVPANTAALDLTASGNIATAAGTRIILCYNGSKWEQVAPVVNVA